MAFLLVAVAVFGLLVYDSSLTGSVVIQRGGDLKDFPDVRETILIQEGTTDDYFFEQKRLLIEGVLECQNPIFMRSSDSKFKRLYIAVDELTQCTLLKSKEKLKINTFLIYDFKEKTLIVIEPEKSFFEEIFEPIALVSVKQANTESHTSVEDVKKFCFNKEVSNVPGDIQINKDGEYFGVFPVVKDLEDPNCLSFKTSESFIAGNYELKRLVVPVV